MSSDMGDNRKKKKKRKEIRVTGVTLYAFSTNKTATEKVMATMDACKFYMAKQRNKTT